MFNKHYWHCLVYVCLNDWIFKSFQISLEHFVFLFVECRLMNKMFYCYCRLLPSVIVWIWRLKRRSICRCMRILTSKPCFVVFFSSSSIVYSSTHRLIVFDFFLRQIIIIIVISSSTSIYLKTLQTFLYTHTHTFIAWRYICILRSIHFDVWMSSSFLVTRHRFKQVNDVLFFSFSSSSSCSLSDWLFSCTQLANARNLMLMLMDLNS